MSIRRINIKHWFCTSSSQPSLAMQEYDKFTRFTDSLLSRSSKLANIAQQLENTLEELGKGPESSDGKRVAKPHAYNLQFLSIQIEYGHVQKNHRRHSKSFKYQANKYSPTMPSLGLRLVESLESAGAVLEKQYEDCEAVKLETSDLKSNGIPEGRKQEPPSFIYIT